MVLSHDVGGLSSHEENGALYRGEDIKAIMSQAATESCLTTNGIREKERKIRAKAENRTAS